MGRDKLFLKVGAVPLLRRVHDALSARCAEVIVVGSGEESARLGDIRWIPDQQRGGLGPLAGMETGLTAATNRLVFVAAGDMPFLSADLVCYLLERLETCGVSAVVPRHRGRAHPLCAAYDREILPQVSSALADGIRAVHEFLERLDHVDYIEKGLQRFGDPDLLLMNVNYPEDLDRARTSWRDWP